MDVGVFLITGTLQHVSLEYRCEPRPARMGFPEISWAFKTRFLYKLLQNSTVIRPSSTVKCNLVQYAHLTLGTVLHVRLGTAETILYS